MHRHIWQNYQFLINTNIIKSLKGEAITLPLKFINSYTQQNYSKTILFVLHFFQYNVVSTVTGLLIKRYFLNLLYVIIQTVPLYIFVLLHRWYYQLFLHKVSLAQDALSYLICSSECLPCSIMVLFPFKSPIKLDILILGGITILKWTWFVHTVLAIISTPLYRTCIIY